MVCARYLLSITVICGVFITTLSQDVSSSCGKSAKTETYIETAAALLDKARENMPEEGTTDCSCPPKPMDCDEILQCGRNKSGIYQIWPRNRVITGSIDVYCDMETHGGGWTLIQRRGDYRRPADFFDKPWHLYKTGFGDLRRDFWLGNENIYALTNQKKYYLRIDLMNFENKSRYASYDQFWIDNENQHYRLHVYDYSGDAGDSFTRMHDNHKFSTVDRDNDNSTDHCAGKHSGGWWYSSCRISNLNGKYHMQSVKSDDGIVWQTWKGIQESLRTTEMKLRPMDFRMDLLDMDIEPA